MQLLAGTDAGKGVRGRVGVWGAFCHHPVLPFLAEVWISS